MLLRRIVLTCLLLALTACGTLATGDPAPGVLATTPTAILFATAPLNPTATMTPFQPVSESETPVQPSILDPLSVLSTPSATSNIPTSTLLPGAPTATFNPDSILPTTTNPTPIYAPANAPAPFPNLTDNETVTFALLGSDTRGGRAFRTDTIIIAAIRPKSGQVTMISIPRDLWVYIPNYGMQRINVAYEYGDIYGYPGNGPALFADTILYNLGIRIDHTALVDFNGFRLIVDTLEGIDVPVYCPYTDWRLIDPSYDPNNENNWALYTVNPGVIHMDGDLALWYARSRKKSNDFDRGRRSQEVLRALYTRALRIDAVAKLPQLYSDLSSTVVTDLGLADIFQLSPLALHLTNADIRSYYIRPPLVSAWTTSQGASVQLPNGPALQSMLQQALSPSVRTPEEQAVTIEVRNGTINPGWDALAAERLNYAGYDTSTALADRTDYPGTLLYDLTSAQDYNQSASLLALLGLPQTALVSAPMPAAGASYVLVVGGDYQPCFNPANMAP